MWRAYLVQLTCSWGPNKLESGQRVGLGWVNPAGTCKLNLLARVCVCVCSSNLGFEVQDGEISVVYWWVEGVLFFLPR